MDLFLKSAAELVVNFGRNEIAAPDITRESSTKSKYVTPRTQVGHCPRPRREAPIRLRSWPQLRPGDSVFADIDVGDINIARHKRNDSVVQT